MQTVLIAGGTGLIGQRLSELLQTKGFRVIHLSRKQNLDRKFPAYQWDLDKGLIAEEAIQEADYVVNLAGAGVADKHWTKARKQLIIDSRVKANRLLKKYFETVKLPKAYISAAAIGYYGDRGNELMTEESEAGKDGFLAESCTQWEKAIDELESLDMRTVRIRVGIVLSSIGGALQKMLLSFNLRTGAYFGDGTAMYSWIHIDDICGIFVKAIEEEEMQGIYNGVAPNPVNVKTLTYDIAKALDKKSLIMPVPAFGLRLGMGEMAAVVLTSTKVSAQKIIDQGYKFQFTDTVTAIKDIVSRKI